MAAVLKKRALAEYSQTIVLNEDTLPVKKLRLVKKPSTESTTLTLINCLETSKTSNEALHTLLHISDTLELDSDNISEAFQKLCAHFAQEQESVVRVKILSMFADIGQENQGEIARILEEVINLLKNETSHKVIAQGLYSMLQLCKCVADNAQITGTVLDIAKNYLKDVSHAVKCRCLEIIGTLTNVKIDLENNEIIHLVQSYFPHSDARVRAQAFSTMVLLNERGLKIKPDIYVNVCEALKDDYEIVRIVVLELLRVLGNSYPENMIVLPESEQEIRLIDDAFGKICNSVNDLSMHVRMHALKLLGSMTLVSSKFLNQTLDKKLMSNMRRKRTAHELAWDNVTSGEWASGKKWADDKPKEVIKADNISLMSSGACGAFVHGLEDEFLEVRSAAVESLCELSTDNGEFANLCLDFLVDMFNDEIEDVRLKAIDCLRKISEYIILRDDQLETILGALEDCSQEVREALHRMLASCTMSTTTGLKICVEKLLDNLKKYPQDRRSTYRCLQRIGARHPALVLALVPSFLAIHPFFDMAECDVDNPQYICILILIFNAAQNSNAIVSLLEPQILKHYLYLKDTISNFVPILSLPNETNKSIIRPTSVPVSLQFLSNVIERLNDESNNRIQCSLFRSAKEQLNRLSDMDENVSGTAQFTSLYIGALLIMSEILEKDFWSNSVSFVNHQSNNLKSNIEQLHLNCLKLQYLFNGLTTNEYLSIKQLQLRALGLNLVHIVKGNASALAHCHHFLSCVEEMQRELTNAKIEPDAFVASLLCELGNVEEHKPGTVSRILIPLLRESKMSKVPNVNTNIKMTHVHIIEPSGQSDSTLKFTAGLIMAVPFEAELLNVVDVNRVRLKVKYPDQKTQIILPRPAHMKPLNLDDNQMQSSGDIRLLTTVLISHQVWSEACNIEISMALAVPEGDIGKKKNITDSHPFLLDLCKPVKVSVSPKPIKRAI